jgi:hypothetical protein
LSSYLHALIAVYHRVKEFPPTGRRGRPRKAVLEPHEEWVYAQVKNLVEMHDGTVEAHSLGIGQGSEFVVRLPIMVKTPKPPPPEPTVSERTTTTARRILVVDCGVRA